MLNGGGVWGQNYCEPTKCRYIHMKKIETNLFVSMEKEETYSQIASYTRPWKE